MFNQFGDTLGIIFEGVVKHISQNEEFVKIEQKFPDICKPIYWERVANLILLEVLE